MRTASVLCILTLAALLLGACQLIAPGLAPAEPTNHADFDFEMPEWGLRHGWVQIHVGPDGQSARWVEVNADLALRYVRTTPRCVTFRPDGQAAMVAVQIDERYGWGEGETGQWMQFWLDREDGEFASPLFPPGDENPGCAYQDSEPIPITAGQIRFGPASASVGP